MRSRVVAVALVFLAFGSERHGLAAARDAGLGDAREARPLEGSWQGTVTIRDCRTQTVLLTFQSMELFTEGGGYVSESSSQPATRATGLGMWRHVSGRRYASWKQFFTYDQQGSPAGALRIATQILLSASGKAYTAKDTFEVLDLTGVVRAQGCGSIEAARLP